MRNRRITVLALVLLSSLAFLDGWLDIIPHSRGQGIEMSQGWSEDLPHSIVSDQVEISARGITRFKVESDAAIVKFRGGDVENIQIAAEVAAAAASVEDAEAYLKDFKIDTIVQGDTAQLTIKPLSAKQGIGTVRMEYTIIVPHGLSLAVDLHRSTVEFEQVNSDIQLDVKYGVATGRGLYGDLTGSISFSTFELSELLGAVDLETAYSNLELDLVDSPEGYHFDVETAFGMVGGVVPLEMKQEEEKMIMQGNVGEGQNPVIIRSRFGNVMLNLE